MIKVGSPQFLFMAEAEGLTDITSTRLTQLNAVINDILDSPSTTLTEDELYYLCRSHNIYDISEEEIDYIIDGIH